MNQTTAALWVMFTTMALLFHPLHGEEWSQSVRLASPSPVAEVSLFGSLNAWAATAFSATALIEWGWGTSRFGFSKASYPWDRSNRLLIEQSTALAFLAVKKFRVGGGGELSRLSEPSGENSLLMVPLAALSVKPDRAEEWLLLLSLGNLADNHPFAATLSYGLQRESWKSTAGVEWRQGDALRFYLAETVVLKKRSALSLAVSGPPATLLVSLSVLFGKNGGQIGVMKHPHWGALGELRLYRNLSLSDEVRFETASPTSSTLHHRGTPLPAKTVASLAAAPP